MTKVFMALCCCGFFSDLMIKMDLNSLGSLSNFDTFDDDVSKESNDLTVDAGESPFLSSVSQAAISHGLSIVPEETQEHHSEPMKRKGGWTKGKKRKKNVKDMNAPKQPLSGYLRFLNERRELIRQEKPNLSFAEMSKQLGNEWSHLAQHEKQRYLDDAEREKEKYMKDLEAYKKTETYKTFKQQIDKKGKGNFLEAIRDAELRQLRKQTTELEEQNAILSKHTDNMRQAVERLEVEAQHQRQTNQALLSHLEALRTCLTSSFSSLPLPGTGELPTLETIDTYMARLHSLILDSPQENESLIATVRDIVGRLSIEL
uniref:HMG box domain-containing protein n=1 Tax=Biomphalaria glabrata TaxID=6526 RepID=A0A2C9K3E4_BIOGL